MAEAKYLSEHYDKKEYRGLEGYKKLGGYEMLAKALKMEPQKIIDEVKARVPIWKNERYQSGQKTWK